jgi:hypothetical protein
MGALWANDTDGFVLKAQPGKSQGRPLTSSGSKPIAQTGLPAYVLPEGPYPGSTEPTNGAGQTLDKTVSCREEEQRERPDSRAVSIDRRTT